MALPKRQSALVNEIAKKYGSVIDLKKSPAVLVEILRNYGRVLDPDPGGGTGGVSPTSIAVAGPPPAPPPTVKPDEASSDVMLSDVMRAVLNVQRDINSINKTLAQKNVKGTR
jgi:hypothetical protein